MCMMNDKFEKLAANNVQRQATPPSYKVNAPGLKDKLETPRKGRPAIVLSKA